MLCKYISTSGTHITNTIDIIISMPVMIHYVYDQQGLIAAGAGVAQLVT